MLFPKTVYHNLVHIAFIQNFGAGKKLMFSSGVFAKNKNRIIGEQYNSYRIISIANISSKTTGKINLLFKKGQPPKEYARLIKSSI